MSFETAFPVCIISFVDMSFSVIKLLVTSSATSPRSVKRELSLWENVERTIEEGTTEPFWKSSWFPRYLWALLHYSSLHFLHFSLRRYCTEYTEVSLYRSRWCTWSSRLSKVATCATEIGIPRYATPAVSVNKTTGSQKGPRNENIGGTNQGSLWKAWDCSSSWWWHKGFPPPRLELLGELCAEFLYERIFFSKVQINILFEDWPVSSEASSLFLMVYVLGNLQHI